MAAGQHDSSVPDPYVMPDRDSLRTTPCEEFVLVAFAIEIGAGPVAEVRLARPIHRVVARIDARHCRDRGELPDTRVRNVAVVDDVGIVTEIDLEQRGARADLGISAER